MSESQLHPAGILGISTLIQKSLWGPPAVAATVAVQKPSQKDTKLVVLDASGLLFEKVVDPQYVSPHGLEVIQQHYYSLVLRPHVREFLKDCFDKYYVGFFSSSMQHTVDPLLDLLLTEEQKSATVFRWYRDRTHFHPERGVASRNDLNPHSTIKRLSSIIENPIVNKYEGWGYHNTIICDDTTTKMEFNPADNVLMFVPFNLDPRDRHLLDMIDKLNQRFESLTMLNFIDCDDETM